MSDDRTALEHLLDGRQALVFEVARLTTAIEELDAVIGQIGGSIALPAVGAAALPPAPHPVTGTPPAGIASRPRTRTSARKSAVKKTSRAAKGNAPKSIRVHVLEMLAAEDRTFGLAEMIDRVHAAGVQAHDDAVRSITIKLMKDGKVERVGRGQYTLARRADNAALLDR